MAVEFSVIHEAWPGFGQKENDTNRTAAVE
jgi:hypothetical protein